MPNTSDSLLLHEVNQFICLLEGLGTDYRPTDADLTVEAFDDLLNDAQLAFSDYRVATPDAANAAEVIERRNQMRETIGRRIEAAKAIIEEASGLRVLIDRSRLLAWADQVRMRVAA